MTGSFDPQMQRMTPPWVVYQQAEQLFEVRNLGTTFDSIPEDISLLWIVQPKGLSNDTLYAIDQFVMAGGRAIIFVDPVADVDPASAEGMPQGMPPIGQGSDLPALFEAWGIEFSAEEVVADAQLGPAGFRHGPAARAALRLPRRVRRSHERRRHHHV